MSVFTDIRKLYRAYGFFTKPITRDQLKFRVEGLLNEEMGEALDALDNKDAEELVDALIDIIVIAAGTLELLKVNSHEAWEEVLRANLTKKRGTKSTRPESGGFDLIKPEGWQAPDHSDNHGELTRLFGGKREAK